MNHSIKEGEYNPCPRCGPKGMDICSGDPKYCPQIDIVPISDMDGVLHYYDKRTDNVTDVKPVDGEVGSALNTMGWWGDAMGRRHGFPTFSSRYADWKPSTERQRT